MGVTVETATDAQLKEAQKIVDARNQPALDFLDSLPSGSRVEKDGVVWQRDLDGEWHEVNQKGRVNFNVTPGGNWNLAGGRVVRNGYPEVTPLPAAESPATNAEAEAPAAVVADKIAADERRIAANNAALEVDSSKVGAEEAQRVATEAADAERDYRKLAMEQGSELAARSERAEAGLRVVRSGGSLWR